MTPFVKSTLFREAADVQRYHTRRTLRQQTVGAHSFNMLMLLAVVYPQARAEVLWAAAHHDLPELHTGDTPAQIKREHPQLSVVLQEIEEQLHPLYAEFGLTPEEERLVKWCDTMELVQWCLEEMRLGNSYVKDIAFRGLVWLHDMQQPSPAAAELLHSVHMAVIGASGDPNPIKEQQA